MIGPFAMTKYIDSQVMELTANDHYWGGRPKLDKIVLYPQPVAASRLSMLTLTAATGARASMPRSTRRKASSSCVRSAPRPTRG